MNPEEREGQKERRELRGEITGLFQSILHAQNLSRGMDRIWRLKSGHPEDQGKPEDGPCERDRKPKDS